MADSNGHVYDVSRDSYVSVYADMQGFLEKKKGVLGNKSKLWCSLQQSTLYMQKSNVPKPQRQGETVKTIDLKDCHQVRKVTTEITGTHLEICQKKKTHVFVCPTSENCSIWVKALQAAMALKDAGQFESDPAAGSQESTHDTNVYEELNESLRYSRQNVSSCKISDYCEPSDVKKVSRIGNNEYWEVGDVQSKQVYNEANSGALEADQCKRDEQLYSDGRSLAQGDKKTVSGTSQANAAVTQRNSIVRRGSANNEEVYSDASSTTSAHHHHPVAATSDSLKDDSKDDEDESPFHTLLDSLNGRDSPIPDYVHPLIEDDMKPVEDLRHFLNKNYELCHVNCLFVPTEDPVNSLKTYLGTLSIVSSSKSGHY